MTAADGELIEALGSSQRLGFLGDLPIPEVIGHARRFVAAIRATGHDSAVRIADIGAGGGVPGLVLAADLPEAGVTLIDRRATRTDHLARLVRRLGLTARVDVRTVDLTVTPADLRGSFDVVTARGFGAPRVTVAAARPLLAPGGRIIISEPPAGRPDRWPDELLAEAAVARDVADVPGVVILRAT